jgi:hypothetical protein
VTLPHLILNWYSPHHCVDIFIAHVIFQYVASHPPQPSWHSCHSISHGELLHINLLPISCAEMGKRWKPNISLYHEHATPNIYICSVLTAPSHHILILGNACNKVGIHEKQLLDHIRSLYVQLMQSYPSYNLLQVTHSRWYFIPSSIPSYQWVYTCRYQSVHVHVHLRVLCVANQQWKWNVWV